MVRKPHPASALAALFFVVTVAADEPVPARTVADEAALLQKGRGRPQKNALARLSLSTDPEADNVLLAQFERLRAGEFPPALWLDLFDAAAKRQHPALKKALADREAELAKSNDPLMRFRECLEGGDSEAGKALFEKTPEPGCIRCHALEGRGGEIGPDLTWLRNSAERSNLLESVVLPNGTMAIGYQSAAIQLKNGEELAGVITHDNPSDFVFTNATDGKKRTIQNADVVKRTTLPSPMPPHFGTALTKRQIRDVIEYLATGE